MPEVGILILAGAVLLVAGFLLLRALRKRTLPGQRDLYLEALEAWVGGDLARANVLLRELIKSDPDAIDPYLQLGDLLRIMGQPEKAAVLHRGLTARPALPVSRKIQVGLSLAEDLLAIDDSQGAGQVLDSLVRRASTMPRYWWIRFRQWVKSGDLTEAKRALDHASGHVPKDQRIQFREGLGFFELDRAFAAVLDDNSHEAASLVRTVPSASSAAKHIPLIQACIQASRGDVNKAMDISAAGLMDSPQSQMAFHEYLRQVLLASGQFDRSIPLLERVCQGPQVPVALILELALLYEKTGRRDQAVELLKNKHDRKDLTPNAVSPFLSVLVRDAGDETFAAVWSALEHPLASTRWHCSACDYSAERLSWFCPRCYGFGPFVSGVAEQELEL